MPTSNTIDIKGYDALSAEVNKTKGEVTPDNAEGIVSEKLPELTLSMKDEEIIKLTSAWEKTWNESSAKTKWEERIKDNENYWLGKQFDQLEADKTRSMVDNLIFEALETFLPQATRRNPEALVELDDTENIEVDAKIEQFLTKIKDRLAGLSDKNKLRLKLKKAVRHWAIYELGAVKYGWSVDRDIPVVKIVRPKKLILDPDATIDEDGYTGDRIGEYRKMTAEKIITIADKAGTKEFIQNIVKDDTKGLATEIQFIEWWTPDYLCWTLKGHVLLKKKNPHWNYDKEEEQTNVDQYGNETTSMEEVEGRNHFPIRKMPYDFLSVFNLGKQPMDDTGLINQNLANQDIINKRNRQIDKNVDSMNGGMVVSLERSGLTKAQASSVTKALRKGGTVLIPTGSPREAVDKYSPSGLPGDVFTDLADKRSRLRDIFGTSGSTPTSVKEEKTVRGKIMTKGLDTDRIGGGVSEYLEQLADNIYNWFLQLLYVYDDDFQFLKGAEIPRVNVSVKEGSLLPKDSISIANQALELANMGRISNIDLYKRLDYPNPEELAANVWLEQNAPELLYKDNEMVRQAIGMQQEVQAMEQMQQEESNLQAPVEPQL